MDPDVLELAQVLAVVGSFVAFGCALFVGMRLALIRTGNPGRASRGELPLIDEARFARLEQAVDAIAVEVERISEAQRFTTKLLSERASEGPAHSSPTSRV